MVRNNCMRTYITGNFSCLEAFLVMERNTGYYMLHVFLPSFLCVVASWLSFWIRLQIAAARISLTILTFLTISQQQAAINQQLPHVSYVKAIDIWLSVSLVFVFGTLLEYAFAQVS